MRALVTGGGGFLGKAIVGRLLERGDDVVSYARGDYPELRDMGVQTIRGDLIESEKLEEAARDCDIVFHVAALARMTGKWQEFYDTNVLGTVNVIDACVRNKIPRLVYTSSPSVVFHGRDMANIGESAAYPRRFLSPYPRSKSMAEWRVLKAADELGLYSVALRPHLIWGPGDKHLVPNIIEKRRQGKLFLVGDGDNLIDPVYIDNAADAHILAADHLEPYCDCPLVGKAYFIGNDEPVKMKTVINAILEAGGEPPVDRSLPLWLAYLAGAANECIQKMHANGSKPEITRFVALQLAREHWFDLSAAKKDFGYAPQVSFEEGMRRLKKSLQAENNR